MKRTSIIYAGLSLLLCIVCSSCRWGVAPPYEQGVILFKLSDTTLLHKVVVIPKEDMAIDTLSEAYLKGKDRYYITSKYIIPTYPKADENAPFFTQRGDFGSCYNVCELATESKYIALKNGYYMVYPYRELLGLTTFLDVDWKQICSVNIDAVPQIQLDYKVFEDAYVIRESTIANLTGKSTIRFNKKTQEQVMLDDVVVLLNRLIEENQLRDYCNGMNYSTDAHFY